MPSYRPAPSLPRRRRPPASLFAVIRLVALLGVAMPFAAAHAANEPFYTLRGDFAEIKAKGSIRFLVHGAADHLPRSGDPRAAERALADELAARLGLAAVFVSVPAQEDLLGQLNDGHGDVIVGSLAVTPERSKRIAFTRPIRFVDQLVVVRTTDTSVQDVTDLAGKAVTVREGSSYAEALRAASVRGILIKPAPGTMETFDILQRVSRGEEPITVADSDLVAAATSFAPNLRGAKAT